MSKKSIFMLCDKTTQKDLRFLNKDKFKANMKYDGERVMASKKNGEVILFNRNNSIVTHKFKEVAEEFDKIDSDFMIDGEVISVDGNFNKLQKRALTKDMFKIEKLQKEIPIKFMAFDIIMLDNKPLLKETLKKRVKILSELLNSYSFKHIEIVEYGDMNLFLEQAIKEDSEGIVIKDMDSCYQANTRSKSWLKLKLFKETTLIIDSYTENNKGIRVEDKQENSCQIAGSQAEKVKQLIDKNEQVTILVQYLEKTKENRLRFPSYKGVVEVK
jgi:ATP-dependent DNA ligase